MGRPSSYSERTAFAICSRLAAGESLVSICDDKHLPHAATVYRWLDVNEAFRDRYTRARESQADALFVEILKISDDGRNDWMAREGDGGSGWALNGEHVQRSRLRIDARKWMAGKLRPKKYGDKQEIELTVQPIVIAKDAEDL